MPFQPARKNPEVIVRWSACLSGSNGRKELEGENSGISAALQKALHRHITLVTEGDGILIDIEVYMTGDDAVIKFLGMGTDIRQTLRPIGKCPFHTSAYFLGEAFSRLFPQSTANGNTSERNGAARFGPIRRP